MYHVAVALCHAYLSLALAPVQNRNRQSDRDHFLIPGLIVGYGQLPVHSGITDCHIEVHLITLALGYGHFIIGLQLAALDVLGK